MDVDDGDMGNGDEDEEDEDEEEDEEEQGEVEEEEEEEQNEEEEEEEGEEDQEGEQEGEGFPSPRDDGAQDEVPQQGSQKELHVQAEEQKKKKVLQARNKYKPVPEVVRWVACATWRTSPFYVLCLSGEYPTTPVGSAVGP